jgi:hypothetical protein
MTALAGDALPDRKQTGSLFYIALRSVERVPGAAPEDTGRQKFAPRCHPHRATLRKNFDQGELS